jgi:hypothetical protein
MLEALKNLIYRVSAHQFAHTDGTPNEIARRPYPGKGQELRAAYVKAAEEAKQQAEAKQSNEAGEDWGQ